MHAQKASSAAGPSRKSSYTSDGIQRGCYKRFVESSQPFVRQEKIEDVMGATNAAKMVIR